jgi:membrane protein YdbS with pleckstrin-like domain
MKNPIELLFKPLAGSYYYQEMVQITTVVSIAAATYLLYSYAHKAIAFASTPQGAIWILAFLAASVLALSIKLFFSVIIFKYSKNPFQYKIMAEHQKSA